MMRANPNSKEAYKANITFAKTTKWQLTKSFIGTGTFMSRHSVTSLSDCEEETRLCSVPNTELWSDGPEMRERAQRELMEAAETGDTQRLHLALSGSKVDIDLGKDCSKGSYPPLHLAALKGYTSAVELLVEHKADVNKHADFGQTPLHLACYKGDPDSVDILLRSGADTESRNNAGWTPMFWTCTKQSPQALVKLMLAGADVNASTLEGWTPLHVACEYGLTHIVKALLLAGANDRAETIHGACPLDVGLAKSHHGLTPIFERIRKRRAREEKDRKLQEQLAAPRVMLLKMRITGRKMVRSVSRKLNDDQDFRVADLKKGNQECSAEAQRALKEAALVVVSRAASASASLAASEGAFSRTTSFLSSKMGGFSRAMSSA